MKKIVIALLALGFASQSFAQKPTKKPNIVLIMVDDLGYSDIGPYGSEIQTPNLDKLAGEGLRLKEFYNNSICAPTRASLLTGLYQHKAGLGYFDVNLGLPAYQGFLNHESVTVGEVLKQAGYSTLMVGKWHVGQDSIGWPNQRGFDKFYGFVGGASNYYDIGSYPEKAPKVPLIKNNKRFNLAPGKYLTEEITNNALEFLTDQNKENKPFFLYMAYNAPHWPLQALPEDIAKYKGKYSIGWDSLRTLRLQKQIQLGIRDPKQKIADRDSEVPYWASLTYDEQQLWQHKMEVYAAMVDRVDQGIGRVLAKLKELKKDENTLIVFISDNGAQGGYVNTAKRKAQRNSGPIGTAGSYDYQEQSWAYVSNTPFRSYKAMAYEGGISAPFIAWYPKGIKANSIAQGTAHLIDLAPTFYELAGAKYPSVYQGNTINPLAGKSLTNVLFEGKDLNRETPLFWERAGNRAVRKGNWKLVSIYPDKKWQLFDLASDRGETTNVADTNPEIVKELSAAYVAWAKKNDVVDYDSIKPTGNQGFAGPPAAAQRTRSSERD